MPIAKVKLFTENSAAKVQADIAAFQAGVGNPALSDQRGSAMHAYYERINDKSRVFAAVAYAGSDVPVTKTADQQFICIEDDHLDQCQAALDAALAEAVHSTVADGVTTTPAHLVSATIGFVSTDVGRKLRIIESGVAVEKTITVYNSATDVTYDAALGSFVSGTGKTVALLGAEVVQNIDVAAYQDPDGDIQHIVMVAVEGQIA